MQKNTVLTKKAFLYNGRFFLFPEGICDGDDLRKACDAEGKLKLTELVEKRCMVPYFVDKYMTESEVTLTDEHGIYPFDAEIMTMKEYNRRLREVVTRICPGCNAFTELTPSDSSLNGHHEEASLNGICFVRDEYEAEYQGAIFICFDEWMKDFAERFGKLKLESKIDAGKLDKASETLYKALCESFFEPDYPVILDKSESGKYRMIYSSLFCDTDSLTSELLCDCLTEKYGEAWEFYNYIPKGKIVDGAIPPVCVSVEKPEGSDRLALTVYYDGEHNGILCYLWLCGLVGEENLRAACYAFDFVKFEGDAPEGVIALSEFAEMVDTIAQEFGKENLIVPFPELASVIVGCNADASEEKQEAHTRLISSRSRVLFFDLISPKMYGEEAKNVWEDEDSGILGVFKRPVARLLFKGDFNGPQGLIDESSADFRRRTQEFLNGLKGKYLIKMSHQLFSSDGLEVGAIVMNLTKLLYEARRLSPILGNIETELVVYTHDGLFDARYKIGFDMEKL